MRRLLKHIANNSEKKFPTKIQLEQCIDDALFQSYKTKLETIIAKKGGICEFFLHSS